MFAAPKLSTSFGAPKKVISRPQISFRQNSFSPFIQNNTNLLRFARNYPKVPVKFPPAGDSVTEGRLQKWHFKIGDFIEEDQSVVSIETDKLVTEVNAPQSGVLVELLATEGTTVFVDKDLFVLDTDAKATDSAAPKAAEPKAEKVAEKVEAAPKAAPKPEAPKPAAPTQPAAQPTPGRERRVKMSVLRERISQRLKDSQNTAAMLTTFQECDMSKLMEMRNEFKDAFFEKHKVKLGFMSAFVKASAAALTDMPIVNAVIDGGDIVYRDFVDISVAVATPTGLVTPVLRDCDKLSFADVEKEIVSLGEKARGVNGRLTMADLTGGTFTISNGGVYGSLMGTPIINPPQSAILGMHGIVDRPVAVNGQIVIRPIMYLALTYDHRLIDGREAVTFLRKIKFGVEDPRRLLLDI